DTFDMLPKGDRGRQMGEEREAPARIFTAAGRAELWAAGAGAGAGLGQSAAEGASPFATREEANKTTSPGADEVAGAFRRSGLMGE
ncbi:MAG TPA: hypothetical protein VE821_00595, partial [Pyrinomonadaceae bacterium]|nr:hypothetical protein [Pyrinomonadaceae bacterium]